MRGILDTHALIWAVDDPERLSTASRVFIADSDSDRLLSAGSVWELGIKIGLGKLRLSLPFLAWMNQAVTDLRLTILPITIACAELQSTLEFHHHDPFDRLLVAHSRIEEAAVISSDAIFDRYAVSRIW